MKRAVTRPLLLYILAQMDERLSAIEFAVGLPQQMQHNEVNELARAMDEPYGYDSIKRKAEAELRKAKGLST